EDRGTSVPRHAEELPAALKGDVVEEVAELRVKGTERRFVDSTGAREPECRAAGPRRSVQHAGENRGDGQIVDPDVVEEHAVRSSVVPRIHATDSAVGFRGKRRWCWGRN